MEFVSLFLFKDIFNWGNLSKERRVRELMIKMLYVVFFRKRLWESLFGNLESSFFLGMN